MYAREVSHQMHQGAAVGIMTSHLIFSLYYRSLLPPNAPGVGEECEVYCGYCRRTVRVVLWILSANSARLGWRYDDDDDDGRLRFARCIVEMGDCWRRGRA